MTSSPSVLVGMPLFAGSLHGLGLMLPIWAHWNRPDFRYLVAVNGPDSATTATAAEMFLQGYEHLKVKVLDVGCGTGDSEWRDQLAGQQAVIAEAVASGCSHILWHETNRIPLPGVLEYLLAARLPVVGALYRDSHQPGYYAVWDFDPVQNHYDFRPFLNIDKITRPTPVPGLGTGFMLVETELLTRVTPRTAPGSGLDTWFCLDMLALGVPVCVCPVLVYNVKVDGDPYLRELWHRTRARLLAEAC